MKKRAKPAEKNVILLKDLAPRADVVGGAKKLRFGEQSPPKVKKSQPLNRR